MPAPPYPGSAPDPYPAPGTPRRAGRGPAHRATGPEGQAVRNIVGARVRRARRGRTPRLTQRDLAALLAAYDVPIGVTGISKIEAGTRPVYDFEVRALCEALAVPAAWLLQLEEL